MQITVLLKLVSQSTFTDSIHSEPRDRLTAGQLVLNPADEYAVEQSLRLRERVPNTHITVITMAPDCAEYLLRYVIAMGADKAIHICDKSFAGSDTLVTARILAESISKLPPQNLILCGQRSIDSETGHIGPQLAAFMGLPVITNVVSIQSCDGGRIQLSRLQDNGMAEISCSTSTVLTICRGTEMVRVPTILGMRRANNVSILRLDRTQFSKRAREAGLDGSPTCVVRSRKIRYVNKEGVNVDDVSQGVETILRVLKKESYDGR